MKKEEIFLDLKKLSENEIKEVWEILKINNECFKTITCGDDTILHYSYNNPNKKYMWFAFSETYLNEIKNKTEINLQQFKELFRKENILNEAEFKLEAIKRGFVKGNTFKPLSGGEEVLIENDLLDFEHYNIKYNYTVYIQDAYIYENGKWAEVTIFNNNDISIPNDLKVGQEIEVNGFVLKVDREVSKWYKVESYPNYIFYKFSLSQLKNIEGFLKFEEITNRDFINQLEMFSK